jgi:hypothetical protein
MVVLSVFQLFEISEVSNEDGVSWGDYHPDSW